jgi:hypothetical protein
MASITYPGRHNVSPSREPKAKPAKAAKVDKPNPDPAAQANSKEAT